MDVEKYFNRINYKGSRTPTLETLHAMTNAHSETIPFENLNVLLGQTIALDEETLFQKLVVERRGGYCFEQNGLFLIVLKQLGFYATPLSARVRIDRPRDYTPPRTHMFIRVELDGKTWLTDVGVGSLSLTKAICLDSEEEQMTLHEPRRIVRENGLYYHQVKLGELWCDVYDFTLEEMPLIDREVANWFTSTNPNSSFKNRVIVALAGKDGSRISLLNDELKIRSRDGQAKIIKIKSPEDLLNILEIYFDLSFPIGTLFDYNGTLR